MILHPDVRRLLTPSVIFLLVANLVPVFGVIYLGWQVFAVMILFWLENVIVGLLNIPRILFADGDETGKGGFPKSLFMAVFFTVHYGLFTYVHGMFVFSMFGKIPDMELSPWLVFSLIGEYQLYWAVAALFASHAFSLVFNFFMKGEYRTVTLKQMMHKPYSRVVILHVGILAGGFVLQMLNEPLLGLLVLLLVKIIIDIRAHLREHRRASGDIVPEQAID